MKKAMIWILVLITICLLTTCIFTSCGKAGPNPASFPEDRSVSPAPSMTAEATTSPAGAKTTATPSPQTTYGPGSTITGTSYQLTLQEAIQSETVGNDDIKVYTAEEGQKFLALFFRFESLSATPIQYDPDALKGFVDGKEARPESLATTIGGYQILSDPVTDTVRLEGYLVWKVPDAWQKLQVSYTIDTSDSFHFVVTPKDLPL